RLKSTAWTCSRQNSLLMATMMKPRYCSSSPMCRSKSSPIFCRLCRVSGRERSSVCPKRAASARIRSRTSRACGTTFRWAVLGFLLFLSEGVSTAVATFASSGLRFAKSHRAGAGELPQGTPEGRNGKDYRVEFLKIPKLCKVKTDGRRIIQTTRLHLLDEPGESSIHDRLRFGRVNEHFDCQGGLLDAGGSVRRASPAAVRILGGQ